MEYRPVQQFRDGLAATFVQRAQHAVPLRARVKTHRQRGESPLQVAALRPEADCNCVAVRQGGEQQEANDQSAG